MENDHAADSSSPSPTIEASVPSPAPPAGWAAFVHENLVVYNPLYLLSAALVLGGLVLLLLEPALCDALGGLVVSGIAELYALALIGSAAILVRGGERRAAVMLGLLAMLYQCDITLHVERAALAGTAGVVTAIAWVALFHLKVTLLSRALGLTLSRSARWVPTVGAAALATLPQVLPSLSLDARGSLVALVVFGLAALVLYTDREVKSAVGFDYRGRRALHGTWWMLAAGFSVHVLDWALESNLPVVRIVPGLVLLSLRPRAASERHAFAIVGFTLAGSALLDPSGLWVVAAMAAVALTLRALRKAELAEATGSENEARAPYRFGSDPSAQTDLGRPTTVFVLAPIEERERLLLAAASAVHLALWSAAAPAGLPHEHLLGLDAALVLVALVVFARGRRCTSWVPALAVGVDLLIETGWLRVPRGPGELGAWALTLGFALLGGGMRLTLRRRPFEDESARVLDGR